jgi:DNA polymerase-3 subunit gamma/tau
VLATTEANKVLPTVVDRCHRFDFGRPSVSQIAEVLRRVADSESIEIPDEAVALVARSATGSFRDALGTLEQLLAYSGAKIVLDDVLAVLGAADADLIFGAIDAVAAGDPRSALLAAASLAESGRDIGRFFGDLEAHARALMIVQVLGDVPPELHVTPEQDERLAEQARRVSAAEVTRLLDLIAIAYRAMKDGADARTQLELALVKAANPQLEPSVKALLARIARLEENRPAAPSGPKTPERPETAAGRATTHAGSVAHGTTVSPVPDADVASPAPAGRTAVAIAAQVEGQPPVAVTAALPGAAHVDQQAVDDTAAAVSRELATEADPSPAVTAVVTVEPEAPAAPPSLGLSLESFGSLWPAVKDELRERSPMLAAALDEASPAGVSETGLTLAWPEDSAFLKRKAEDPANNDLLVKAIRSVTGNSLRLAYELRAAADIQTATPVAPTLSDDDLVQRFMDEFDAEELPPEPEEQT